MFLYKCGFVFKAQNVCFELFFEAGERALRLAKVIKMFSHIIIVDLIYVNEYFVAKYHPYWWFIHEDTD